MTGLDLRTFLRKILPTAVAAFAITSWASADWLQAREAEASSQLEQGAAIIAARSVYKNACGGCHEGSFGDLGTANVDFSSPSALIKLTPEEIAETLSDDAHAATGRSLSQEERASVIAYVRNFLMLPAPEKDTGVGRSIYSRTCSVCHGERGDAASWAKHSLDPSPADFTTHSRKQLTREAMIHAVTFGKDRSAMMPFAVQLNAEEIAATVDYIRATFMAETGGATGHGDHDHSASVTNGVENSFPGGLVGDEQWGRAFYNANCAECHGENGGGNGPRAYFMVVKPKNFLTEGARAELDRPTLFREISNGVTGTTMPAWRTVLTEQQIANVAEYVYEAILKPDDPTSSSSHDHKKGAEHDEHGGHDSHVDHGQTGHHAKKN